MYKRILLLWFMLLTACNSTEPISNTVPMLRPTVTPLSATSTPEPCSFVEANQNLPEISSKIDQAIKQLQPEASARANAYGENCIYASTGEATFSAMETDFYFTINVKNIKDDNELGTWIINVMKIIDALPPTSFAGPQAGFVEFTFKSKNDQRTLQIPLNQYKSIFPGIKPADVIPTLFPTP